MNGVAVGYTYLCLALTPAAVSCQAAPDRGASAVTFVAGGSYGRDATFQVALGDFDGDGDLDAVFANMHSESEVWINDGSGSFANSNQQLGPAAHGVCVGDLDGDGDLDLLITRASRTVPGSVFFNDGSGRFVPAGHDMGDRRQAANFVSLFDLEGDGDLDAGVYYADRVSALYTNDGTGRFTMWGARVPGLVAWGDLDGDGDVDGVAQRFEGGYLTLLNDGDGSFVESGLVQAPGSFVPGNAVLGDVDNDGDLDLVGANGGTSPDTPLTILRNDGTGRFTYVPAERFVTGFGRVSSGDIDRDGTLDVFVSWYGLPDAVGLNDGNGGFADAGLRLGSTDWEGVSALGDLDGDGDLDIFVARYDPAGANQVWFNQAR